MNKTNVVCCANCGKDGGASLKTCMSCMSVKYCNAKCKRNHWSRHNKKCKQRAAELRDEALFKDPPPKEDCPICFLPMPVNLISCMTLPPATISSVPIHDYAMANERLASLNTNQYYSCCGKSICKGCSYSFDQCGNEDRCPFCNSDRGNKTDEESVVEMMKRVEVNDAGAMCQLGFYYYHGREGLHQDREKAIELYARSANLGSSKAHFYLGGVYQEGGDLNMAKFHWEVAAIAGHELARDNLGIMDYNSGKYEQAAKQWKIAASAGHHKAMYNLRVDFEEGALSRESIDSILIAYNNSCAEVRSEARDAAIREYISDE
jgi:tetratricopeptide (TPR) repeat protein